MPAPERLSFFPLVNVEIIKYSLHIFDRFFIAISGLVKWYNVP
jgi:hypothetical protein